MLTNIDAAGRHGNAPPFANVDQLRKGFDEAGYDVQASDQHLAWLFDMFGKYPVADTSKPGLGLAMRGGFVTPPADDTVTVNCGRTKD